MKNICKYILPIMLILFLIFSLCACSKEEEHTYVDPDAGGMMGGANDDGIIIEDDNNSGDNTTTKPTVNIHAIKTEEYEGVNQEGFVFDKTLVLNKYSFILPCPLDEFLSGTKAQLKDSTILSQVSKTNNVTADCFIEYRDKVVNFTITIGKNNEDINTVKGLTIKSDNRISNNNFEGTPNLISCGFSFFECDMDNNQFLNLKKDFTKQAQHKENDDGTATYTLTLETAKDEYWKIDIKATATTKEVEYYFFEEVSITTIK